MEECVASGIEHIIIVTGKGKNSIEDHFDNSPLLERFLEEKGKHDQAELVRRISNMVQVSYTRQKEPLGLGHAVLVAKDLVGDEPFAVLLGDVLIRNLPLANDSSAFAISSKSPSPKKPRPILRSPADTCSLLRFSAAWSAPNLVPAAKSSSPTLCASWPKS